MMCVQVPMFLCMLEWDFHSNLFEILCLNKVIHTVYTSEGLAAAIAGAFRSLRFQGWPLCLLSALYGVDMSTRVCSSLASNVTAMLVV